MPALADLQLRDPFVLPDPVRGRYLLFGTTGFGEAAHGGFLVRTSADLANWSDPQPALSPADAPAGATHFWAPEVHAYRGRWYLFGTFSHGEIEHPGRRYTAVAVADNPAGPYAMLTGEPLTPPGWLAIDGTLHLAPDGTPWLVFVHEWLQVTDGAIAAAPLTPDLRTLAAAPRRLFRASEAPWSLPQSWGGHSGYRVTDGPWLHRNATGVLLLLWSSFGQGGYLTGVARSATGNILGPWLQEATPLYSHDGGHPMLFRDFAGALRLALHTPNVIGRERPAFLPIRETATGLVLA